MSRASAETLLRWLKNHVETPQALDWLLGAPPEYLACRIKHQFPELLPGPLPEGMTWEPAPERRGCYQVTFVCPRCKTTKTETTGKAGLFTSEETDRKYTWPDGYKTPPGSYITPTMCKTELHRRFMEYQETMSQ